MRLHGEAHNTQAIGAKVELVGGQFQIRNRVAAGGSYLSGSTLCSSSRREQPSRS